MKKTYINLVMLLVVSGLFTIQSCKKDDAPTPVAYLAAVPATPVPGDAAVIPYTGGTQTLNLKWSGTATNAIKWDVYFDNVDGSTKVASNVAANAYDVSVASGGTYYWKVVTVDANNVKSTSPVWTVIVNSPPAAPSAYVPANLATNVSISAALTWACSDPEDDDITYSVYVGKTADNLAVVGQVKNTKSFSPTLDINTTYFWKVIATDANGAKTEGPVQSFTTGTLPVLTFVSAYNVAELAVQNGAYAYTCAFTKVDNSTIQCDNWWDSGWAVKLVLDFTKNTVTMTPFTAVSGATTYYATGSGKIDPVTGKITLAYFITKNGVLLENGTDTFTK
jgi:hypothetical protein